MQNNDVLWLHDKQCKKAIERVLKETSPKFRENRGFFVNQREIVAILLEG